MSKPNYYEICDSVRQVGLKLRGYATELEALHAEEREEARQDGWCKGHDALEEEIAAALGEEGIDTNYELREIVARIQQERDKFRKDKERLDWFDSYVEFDHVVARLRGKPGDIREAIDLAREEDESNIRR